MADPTLPGLAGLRVLVAEDSADLRQMLERWLAHHGCEVRTASDGFEALGEARNARFDVLVTDLRMPGLSGLDLLSAMRDLDPNLAVLVLTGSDRVDDAIAALREGRAYDYLRKPLRDLKQLNQAILAAVAHTRGRRSSPAPGSWAEPVAPLSERELQVLRLLAEGLDNRAIADRLDLSEKTIKNHLSHVYDKLGVASRTQALLAAHQLGLV